MTAAGTRTGGGLCNRSITDLATSAAERRVSGGFWALGLSVRVFGAGSTTLAAPDTDLRPALPTGFGADLRTGFGVAARIGALAAVAVALDARSWAAVVAAVAAASTLRRACFAAFFSDLNALRACFSSALADRMCSFALAARTAALAAADFNCCIVAGLLAMIFKTALEIKTP